MELSDFTNWPDTLILGRVIVDNTSAESDKECIQKCMDTEADEGGCTFWAWCPPWARSG